MNKTLSKLLLISGSILLSGGVIALPFSLLSINSNSIVIGNFQSYMSPTVMDEINSEYKINWQYYSSNAEIPTYIQNKTLDIAVATNNTVGQLVVQNSIQPIEWERFNIKTSDGELVKTYKDLKGVVTDFVWNLCDVLGKSIGIENLLEYCIPYFCQNLVFAYNGEKISDNRMDDNADFNNIFSYITDQNITNNRFIGENSSVMMIKDARTVYDVCKLINNQDINPNEAIISLNNKNNVSSPSIEEISSTYDNIYKKYSGIKNKNIITFNSDSNVILNKFANNEINGAFFYNGDAIYSLIGGDNISIADEYDSAQIDEWTNQKHVIIPKNNFIAMDAFVINKSLDESKKDDVYNIIKSISLDIDNNLTSVDENDDFISPTMNNFDYVNYTPCYQSLYDYVINDYFKECFPNNPKLSALLERIISINPNDISDKTIELPINNLAESNMNIAFTGFIDKI